MTRVFALLMFAVAIAACSDSTTAPTTTTTTTTAVTSTETFIGTLAVAGSAFCPFTVTTAGTANATLASLLVSPGGSPVTTMVVLGVGTSTDTPTTSACTLTNCTLATQATVAPALTAQISGASVPKGQNCVAVLDTTPSTMTVPLDFAIRVVHP